MNLSNRLNCTSLSKKNVITFILRNGKKVRTPIGPIFLYNEVNSSANKVAILTKKSIGKAHLRNYLKRIIRFYVRSEFTLFEKFNRVIFLCSFTNPKIEYNNLKNIYNKALDSV